jgi:hypothetical protein
VEAEGVMNLELTSRVLGRRLCVGGGGGGGGGVGLSETLTVVVSCIVEIETQRN